MVKNDFKIHYVGSVANQDIIKERKPFQGTNAGGKRTFFIAESLQRTINIITQGDGQKFGIFNAKKLQLTHIISAYFPPLINFNFFNINISKLFYSLYLLIYLMQKVKKNDWVILYNCNTFHVLPVVLAKFFKKYKYILHIEELYCYERKFIRERMQNFAAKYSTACFAVNTIIIKHIHYKKPYLITKGYSTFRDEYLNFYSNNHDIPTIFYAGRIENVGGVEFILDAIPYINKKCRLIITGSGSLEEKFKQYQSTNPLVEYEYKGLLKEEDFYCHLINAKIGLNPIRISNIFSQWSFPSKILQYLEFGCIVVSTNIPAVKELTQFDSLFKIYNHDSAIELANAINEALNTSINKTEVIQMLKQHFQDEKNNIYTFFNKLNQ